ncbi:polysaccharide biosynthesis tyrosine autokinase [Tsuneonella sp. CC-YZS046]|uniref:GumC family protein n=1 Tax=Tsuneonella sp. CC-YZS046 TaxID=3042152 RepID=UPI002D780E91|nr:polysaccharide biosynthesis tyrosine autokinase [Tsuneonella sp. CC-YZS046]WRO65641.1 polysaccharide biosynthesis tyrosine autokinase [Tsuneonella sp. CC-YZS046]
MNLPELFDEPKIAPATSGIGRGVDTSMAEQESERLNFRLFLNMLRRQSRLFLSTFALLLTFGVLMTLLQPKMYESNAVVLLKSTDQKLEKRVTERADEETMQGDADVSTQIQIIGSVDLARDVVRKLNLIEDPKVNPWLDPQPSLLGRLFGADPQPVDLAKLSPEQREAMEAKLAQIVRYGLGAERLGTAYSVRIVYRSSDPEVAAKMANAFATEYVQSQVTRKKDETAEAAEFLSAKVEELRNQATSDFAAVQHYRVSHGLLSNAATALTEQDISVYNQQTASARAEAAADIARLATARRQLQGGSTGDDVGEALSSSVVSSLRTQRAQIAARVADLSARYGSRHPELLRAKEELASVDSQIQAEIDRVISNLEAKAAVSSGRLASLNSTLGSAKGELARNNSALITLADLQRRAEASQGLYESYLARYRELMAGSGTEQPEARILAEALPATAPYSPNVMLNLILAGLCGIVFGVILALAAEMQYKGLTTAADVEKKVGLPYLGLTPDNKSIDRHAPTPLDTLTEQPDSVLAEAVRGIHAATHIPVAGRGRVLAITSALPGEGKTVLSAMLGKTAADSGVSTVIVDCDIILRGLSRLYGLNHGAGLREIANGEETLDNTLRFIDDRDHAILPITSSAEAGERLTAKGAIQAVVAQLKEHFDLVLLDCPPLLAIAEAREIAAMADGVLLAAHWRKTSSDAVRAAARLLPPRLSNFTGVVLSRVDLRKQNRYANDETAAYASAYQRYMTAAA